jgi:hypothetical protein
MAPHGDLTSTGTCLASPGKEYVVYSPTEQPFTVDLTAARDVSFTTRWHDPQTGRFRPAAQTPGGGVRQLAPPFPGDAVLHLAAAP